MRHLYRPGVSQLYGQQVKCNSNPQNHFIRPGKTFCQLWNYDRITLIGGPAGRAGWRAVFPNEKCKLSAGCTEDRRAGRWAAQTSSGPAGCGKGRGGLQKRAAFRPALFRSPAYCAAHQPALMCSPLARSAVQPAGPPFCAACQPTENSCFSFGNAPSSPPGLPALRLVLSIMIAYINKELVNLEYNISQNNDI